MEKRPDPIARALERLEGIPSSEAARPSRVAPVALVVVGLMLVVIGLVSPLRDWVGGGFGTDRLLLLAVGFQFFYIAVLLQEKDRLRTRFKELLDQILRAFYGKNYQRERQAIDILIQAVEGLDDAVCTSAISHLRRLTGKDFGRDAEAWREWWSKSRSTFRRADLPSREEPPPS
ncbi:MAG: hypothetical protein AB1486_04330 [Planctomycetota bacterium]